MICELLKRVKSLTLSKLVSKFYSTFLASPLSLSLSVCLSVCLSVSLVLVSHINPVCLPACLPAFLLCTAVDKLAGKDSLHPTIIEEFSVARTDVENSKVISVLKKAIKVVFICVCIYVYMYVCVCVLGCCICDNYYV